MIPIRRLVPAVIVLATGIAAWISPAMAQWNSSATAPFAAKASADESLRLSPDAASATRLRLDPMDAGVIDAVRRANTDGFHKRLQIGIGRALPSGIEATSGSLRWVDVAGGIAAHWEITSPEARALRIGMVAARIESDVQIRFMGRGRADTVYGPFSAHDLAAGGPTYWSPVLEGDSATVEVFIAQGGSPFDLGLTLTLASHLFASPADPDAESLAKASQSCEVDFICRAAGDSALATTGRSVAKMTFSDGLGGGTFLCTGTLLNPGGGTFTPYFYSANHCMSTQSSANTLTTHWFYERTGCGSGTISPSYVQIPGGAALLYANTYQDALLLRLNNAPPAGAVFSGWDAATLASGTPLTAVHHPAGDLKKVSLGTMGGFGSPTDSTSRFIISRWNSLATGVTEGGSSGSGIFAPVGQPATEYRLRGGLYGGPSSCTASASNRLDYYSRFDQVYPSISQFLSPGGSTCTYVLSPTSRTVNAGATTGSLSVTSTAGCAWSAASNDSWLAASGSGSGSGTVTYSVAANGGGLRVGTLTIAGQAFTVTQQGTGGVNAIVNPGFESGTAAWTQSATGGFDIITDDLTTAHSGSWYAWLGGYVSGTDTLYEQVTIPAGTGQAPLRFWYRIATNESSTTTVYDTMTVEVASLATGARLATLASFSNLNPTNGWVLSAPFDMSAFRGQTVYLVFTATNDFSDITNFRIDDIELTAGGAAATPNYTALWWIPSESGWGINLNHQGNIVFATLFTYDAAGAPMWLVMSNGAKQPGGEIFAGPLYRTTGPAFNANPFTPIGAANLTQVGTMSITFAGETAMLTYIVNGVTVTKATQKQVFGARAAICQPTESDRGALTNYQDLWWNAAESGWGVNVTHQGDILFATLFTYDLNGRGLWLVMSAGTRQADGSYLGDLYRTTGPAFNAQPFTPITAANLTRVGTMRFRFTNGVAGTLTYTVDGVTVTKAITRQVFSSPVPSCQG